MSVLWPPMPSCELGRDCVDVACVPHRTRDAVELTAAIALADPHSAALVSLPLSARTADLDDIASEAATAMTLIATYLQRLYSCCELCWVVELSTDDRPHVHVALWGSRVRVDTFRRSCRAAGLDGYVGLQTRSGTRVDLARYLMKGSLHALTLSPGEAATLLRFAAELNSGTLVNATPGFWRDSNGVPLVRAEARRLALPRYLRPILAWAGYYPWASRTPPRLLEQLRGSDADLREEP
jgi:hypothetical protein